MGGDVGNMTMVQAPPQLQTLYPDSDGKPMAENTEQYEWIVRIVENLKTLLQDQTAFVAGDLLWYPVQVEKDETPPSQAPDAMVVLGRPAGYRGSYQQWQEDGIAPQVVFEIISPSNTFAEMADKQRFYQRYGTQEMYFYNPKTKNFWGFIKKEQVWEFISDLHLPWISPLLQIQFRMFEDGLDLFYPNGKPFKTLAELTQERDQAQAERDAAWAERDVAQEKLEKAIAKMKAAGLDLDDL